MVENSKNFLKLSKLDTTAEEKLKTQIFAKIDFRKTTWYSKKPYFYVYWCLKQVEWFHIHFTNLFTFFMI